jgi:hypothetical protein
LRSLVPHRRHDDIVKSEPLNGLACHSCVITYRVTHA